MENKKTNRANLENKKFIFLQIGMITALGISLLAFEWRSYDSRVYEKYVSGWTEIEDLLPLNTRQDKPLPPAPAVKPVIIINITEDPIDMPDDFPRIDAGFNENWANPVYTPQLSEEVSNTAEDTIYNTYSIEVQPEFPGGEVALYNFLSENIKYPRMAIEANIQGTAIISFVVEKDGNLSNIRVERAPDNLLSDEAMRVVSAMPRWIPGNQGGRPFRVAFYLPVKFKLE